jgi:hypothetical protein
VESKGGQTVVAYTKDEGHEVSMNDAIANVDKVEEARRLARQQANEEYRNRQYNRNRPPYRDRTGDRGPRTPRPTIAVAKPVAETTEKVEVKEVIAPKEGE